MDETDLRQIINCISTYNHVFCVDNLIELVEELFSPELANDQRTINWLIRKIDNDSNFIGIHDSEGECTHFVARESLIGWYVNLNIRLSEAKVAKLNTDRLLLLMNSLCKEQIWQSLPVEIVDFGEVWSLISRGMDTNEYVFPLARVLSFCSSSMSVIKGAKDFLTRMSSVGNTEKINDNEFKIFLEMILTDLPRRERRVIEMRYGFAGNSVMTLEQIGKRMGLTRERIRQIESKALRKINHPKRREVLGSALTSYLLGRQNSLVVDGEPESELFFIAERLAIPLIPLPMTSVHLLGQDAFFFSNVRVIEDILPDIEKSAVILEERLPLVLGRHDWFKVTEALSHPVLTHMTKTKKVLLALKKIGRPAHYSEIHKKYCELFPKEKVSVHNLHAILGREEHDIVWIGIRGTYALKEWGYERPSATLFETVAQIVKRRYEDTGQPIPFTVVQAEIGKYRKVININSVFLASFFNPALTKTSEGHLMPKDSGEPQDENEASNGELDDVLRRFEERFRNS